jgi:integrase
MSITPAVIDLAPELDSYPILPIELQDTIEAAREYFYAQKSPATLKAYQSAFKQFCKWCQRYQLSAEPATPETVVLFLTDQARAGLAVSTLKKQLSAIHYVHRLKGLPSPANHEKVRGQLAGIGRTHGSQPRLKKDPILDHQVVAMLRMCPPTLIGKRDRAILALGFAGAFRRSELAALKVEDLTFQKNSHLICMITRSKTDQAGRGFEKPIYNGQKLQPVHHLRAWLEQAGIEEGYVFRRIDWGGAALEEGLTGHWIARIVQHYAALIGMDRKSIGAHSLRSGFITSAGERNAPLYKIMEVTGQKDSQTVLRYLRRPNLFREHVGADFL